MGAAVRQAVDLVTERKAAYRANGIGPSIGLAISDY